MASVKEIQISTLREAARMLQIRTDFTSQMAILNSVENSLQIVNDPSAEYILARTKWVKGQLKNGDRVTNHSICRILADEIEQFCY